jgi:hypothetical protein
VSGRTLAARVGVPEQSLASARDLAAWAERSGELALALALWEGCAALDDAPAAWRAVARLALALSDLPRAHDASARAGSLLAPQPSEIIGLPRGNSHDRS